MPFSDDELKIKYHSIITHKTHKISKNKYKQEEKKILDEMRKEGG